ncbi:RNA degradosome polyphosphate kinase [Proteiniclasticum sp. QWL-01]|uniref:RNA degradosome polyphosphate kinase n=1 Tax=Proteiniclasticum sp. QWL-01 TaxID=3036945 RepID=UPI0021FD3F64|nr:RNA degradosome polyphosphate kinase [Proteiniclasticum sp. QWL-01]UUM13192.1 RNA degradosome polyphosphate kinase [Clostridiaceae bacterium HFYG-1003]WFF71619.1 RNA degradosome polyphosphate kinase [Proteiniclasticum sp. QWL-01]
MEEIILTHENYINRELSFMEFNQRVLEEARDLSNPLFERLKFASIVTSNLEEFYMIRYGSLSDQIAAGLKKTDPSGLTPKEQTRAIDDRTRKLLADLYKTFNEELIPAARSVQFRILHREELKPEQLSYLNQLYEDSIFPVLTPMVIDSSRPFPLIMNNTLNIALHLLDSEGRAFLGTVQVPSVLDRFYRIPGGKARQFILLEDIIKLHLSNLFDAYQIQDLVCYKVTRNADLEYDEDDAQDLLMVIKETLKQRKWGRVLKLEVEHTISDDLLNMLIDRFEIEMSNVFRLDGPLDLTFLSKIANLPGHEGLKFESIQSMPVPEITLAQDIFKAIAKQDILIHHPYESFDSVIQLVRTSAKDPNVLAIKMTLYRVSGNSPIVEALAEAAENGKQVTVLVELKARFDEENNINWALRLEKAGCHVIYGIVGLKTHCKALLIIRRENNKIQRYVHLGTGNYNDVTARLYTDIGLLTIRQELGEDISNMFNRLSGQTLIKTLNKVSMAPDYMRERFSELIRNEARHARQGKKARIIAKMNSLVDKEIIQELYKASRDGVEIDLIVRGICCLRPNVKGLSENIRVRSLVGRFLEHSRIFYFYDNGKDNYYISSADWMERNLNKRIELLIPVEDKKCKEKLRELLSITMSDTAKSRILLSDGTYRRVEPKGQPFNSQEAFIELSRKRFEKFKKKLNKEGVQDEDQSM